MLTRFVFLAYFISNAVSFLAQENEGTNELPMLTVMGQETANQRPVTTYETPISNLDFDPRVDMQSRNMAEAQGDLSIRGGTFENTGIKVGSATSWIHKQDITPPNSLLLQKCWGNPKC